ncbi:ParB N-terminal domain-containing protein [Azospirillum baldaniorum]|uniref:ParB N-terminal domain-containing protein n=1 Tax=Azospirillum baldaniorum TaxID=1064539 RepID=UPI001FFF28D7|nr:ParB N-terminal domain-containing protein [Azospirillum baldaniorum]
MSSRKQPAAHHVGGPSEIRSIPIDRIRVLNPRSRNQKVFSGLVESIATVGLKRPVTVTENGADGEGPFYDLVCGQGRMEAFKALGETRIPAMVVEAGEADLYLISLIENLAPFQSGSAHRGPRAGGARLRCDEDRRKDRP